MDKDRRELETPLPEDNPPRRGGKVRGKTQATVVQSISTEHEENGQRLLSVIQKLRALQLGATAAQEMADVIQFVEEEE
jgi:hypothetical protein